LGYTALGFLLYAIAHPRQSNLHLQRMILLAEGDGWIFLYSFLASLVSLGACMLMLECRIVELLRIVECQNGECRIVECLIVAPLIGRSQCQPDCGFTTCITARLCRQPHLFSILIATPSRVSGKTCSVSPLAYDHIQTSTASLVAEHISSCLSTLSTLAGAA
jgi:hypothetical protein